MDTNLDQLYINSENQLPELQITRYVPYLPTSVFFDDKDFSLAHGRILNSGKTSQRVFIDVSVENVSDVIKVDAFDIPPGESELPQIRMPHFTKEDSERLQHTIERSTVTMELSLQGKGVVYRKSWDIWLSQPDLVLIAQLDQEGQIKDYSSILAWWVNSGAKGIEHLLADILPLKVRSRLGYPSPSAKISESEYSKHVNRQVQALFDGLKRLELKYLPTETPWIAEDKMIIQRVRSPERILGDENLPINCLDGAILFASLLEYMGLEPILVLAQKHALVGWKHRPIAIELENPQRISEICSFLDPTALTTEVDFYEAISFAQGHWMQMIRTSPEDRNRSLADFMRIIDVKAERGKPPVRRFSSADDARKTWNDRDQYKRAQELFRIASQAEEKERLKAIRELQAMATDEALKILSRIARNNDSLNARTIAILALGEIRNPAIIDVLKETAYDQRAAAVRAASIRALVKIGDPATASIFRELTDDPDVSVQAAAITAIGALKLTQYREIIIKFLTSENPVLAKAAEAALQNLNRRLRI